MTTQKTGYTIVLEPSLRDANYVPPVYDLRKNQLTLAERIRMNGRGPQITRAEAIAIGYNAAEIDRLLPAPENEEEGR